MCLRGPPALLLNLPRAVASPALGPQGKALLTASLYKGLVPTIGKNPKMVIMKLVVNSEGGIAPLPHPPESPPIGHKPVRLRTPALLNFPQTRR